MISAHPLYILTRVFETVQESFLEHKLVEKDAICPTPIDRRFSRVSPEILAQKVGFESNIYYLYSLPLPEYITKIEPIR